MAVTKALEQYKKTKMYQGLADLNEYMKAEDLEPLKLQVVGGFALVAEGYRGKDNETDIDFVGPDLPDKLKQKIDEIGIARGLGRGWINNDIMLSGSSLEELEASTGELHFHHLFDMEKISMDILDAKDLLRMKVIAIDTSLTGAELGGEFTRAKDLKDVAALMERRGLDMLGLELETYKHVINDRTYELIEDYLQTRDISKYIEPFKEEKQTNSVKKSHGDAR